VYGYNSKEGSAGKTGALFFFLKKLSDKKKNKNKNKNS